MDRHFGHYVRILHWCTDQRMTAALTDVDLTASQGPILGYIAHRKSPPCSRDIEEAFRLSHPTVSGLLARLEKKGLIEAVSSPADRRVKLARLTEEGIRLHAQSRQNVVDSEERLTAHLSPEEKEIFLSCLKKVYEAVK